ncbi:non-heme iron oxygenase ferredoxin subunit [Bordetella genomosp. 4]|uniref:Ferredoxin n=1 Tax=Bordetella genomosp. 4 TaxID=463044 RepID=A0A261U3K2_9BORD|nr:non-heme iron oxygenase ferredoxin subunit [Bordetella genomosp. 4]OZI49905.1 ferredoxin [Bordetella genomosp. 4]OZI56057.1 ferredoxin [Bordetella genomosp. 4]
MNWTRIASVQDIDDDSAISITAGQAQLALYKCGGEFFLSDGICTHGHAMLAEGYVEDGCVECPLHQAQFDLRTGIPQCGPATVPIRVYPVRVEDGAVYAQLDT